LESNLDGFINERKLFVKELRLLVPDESAKAEDVELFMLDEACGNF